MKTLSSSHCKPVKIWVRSELDAFCPGCTLHGLVVVYAQYVYLLFCGRAWVFYQFPVLVSFFSESFSVSNLMERCSLLAIL